MDTTVIIRSDSLINQMAADRVIVPKVRFCTVSATLVSFHHIEITITNRSITTTVDLV